MVYDNGKRENMEYDYFSFGSEQWPYTVAKKVTAGVSSSWEAWDRNGIVDTTPVFNFAFTTFNQMPYDTYYIEITYPE